MSDKAKPKFMAGPLKGNLAAAYAAMDANIDIVTAYPITPQTTVVEKLSELVGEQEFIDRGQNVDFMRMESEHSVAGALVGASFAGARTYSATAGQGLVYMAEMVHWMAGARLPVVLSVAARALTGGGWNIWADYNDIMSLRNSGIIIQLLASHQEIYDTILQSFNISENPEILLPVFPAYAGFSLSHTAKPVERIPWKEAQNFVIPKTEEWPHVWVDSERPIMSAALIMPQSHYYEYRVKIHEAQMKAKQVIKDTMAEFGKKFGRSYGNGMVVPYRTEDAEVIIISYGTLALQMEDAIDAMREQGYKVGGLRLRTYRPFPTEDIIEYAKKVSVMGVVDRAIDFGSTLGGPVSTDVSAAIQANNEAKNTKIVPFIAGLGGRDVTFDDQIDQIKTLFYLKENGKLPDKSNKLWGTFWTGLIVGNTKPVESTETYHGDI